MPLRKTYTEMLNRPGEPAVYVTAKALAGVPVGARMLITTAKEVREYICGIPLGTTRTIKQLRDDLAKQHGADVACPMTTGIYLRIVAEAAFEAFEKGVPAERITPFWRVIAPEDKVAKKLRCGPDFLIARRREEEMLDGVAA